MSVEIPTPEETMTFEQIERLYLFTDLLQPHENAQRKQHIVDLHAFDVISDEETAFLVDHFDLRSA